MDQSLSIDLFSSIMPSFPAHQIYSIFHGWLNNGGCFIICFTATQHTTQIKPDPSHCSDFNLELNALQGVKTFSLTWFILWLSYHPRWLFIWLPPFLSSVPRVGCRAVWAENCHRAGPAGGSGGGAGEERVFLQEQCSPPVALHHLWPPCARSQEVLRQILLRVSGSHQWV